jgi:hypothetical protein
MSTKATSISCPECGTGLEVINLSPIELDLAPDVEDDEDDELDKGSEDEEEDEEEDWEE